MQARQPIGEKFRRHERLVVGCLAFLFTYVFFYEYLPPFKSVHLWSDAVGYHHPLQMYARAALKEGRLPLWDATIYCGISFAGNIQAALFYPPNWLLYAATVRSAKLPFKAMEVFTFLHVWLAFLLSYIWLRGRAGKMASALGGSVFAYSGFMLYQAVHTGVVCAITWIPLGLWGIDEAVERRNWRPLWKVAAASTLSLLAGYPAEWIACCLLTGAYALASREHWRALVGASVAIAASLVLAAIQLLPALDAHSLMVLEPKYGIGSWNWRTFFHSYLLPNWYNFNFGNTTDFDPGGLYLYLGLPTLFAILWAVRQGKFRPYFQPLFTAAVIFFVANPPRWLVALVERIPALEDTMWMLPFLVGIAPPAALITALSLESFFATKSLRRRPLPSWTAVAVGVIMAAWSIRQIRIMARGGRFPTADAATAWTAVALVVFSAGLWAFRVHSGRLRTVLGVMLLLVAGVDYKVYGAVRWFDAVKGDEDELHDAHGLRGLNQPAFQALIANGRYRIMCDEHAAPYSTDLRAWGLTTPQGFDPFLPVQYRDRIERWVKFRTNREFYIDPHNDDMLQSLGVRYVITHEGTSSQPFLAASPDFKLVGTGDTFYLVYEYRHAVPPYRWENAATGGVQPVYWKPERREFQVQSDHGGRFVLVEQFFPGWHATVDGRPVPIERWDGAFQAIAVPPGAHRLRFQFAPTSLRTGALLSLSALIFLCVVVLRR
jgi:hypothetical protein